MVAISEKETVWVSDPFLFFPRAHMYLYNCLEDRSRDWVRDFPCCCDAIADKGNLEKEGLILAHSVRMFHLAEGVKVAAGRQLVHSFCSQEAERNACWCSASCLLSSQRLYKECPYSPWWMFWPHLTQSRNFLTRRPHSWWWVFLPHLIQSRNFLTGPHTHGGGSSDLP